MAVKGSLGSSNKKKNNTLESIKKGKLKGKGKKKSMRQDKCFIWVRKANVRRNALNS